MEDHQVPGLLIEVLYVEHCPNFPAALALVQRVAAELAIDVEVRTTMIIDQPSGRVAGTAPGSTNELPAAKLTVRFRPRRAASEAGGRVGVGPGLLRRPPSSESHRWRPLLVPPRSH